MKQIYSNSYFLLTFDGARLVWLCALLLLCSCSEGVVKLPENMTFPAVFAFGDSIVDTGNNNLIKTLIYCNFVPYGKDFQGGIPTGRFSNGKTPPDLVGNHL